MLEELIKNAREHRIVKWQLKNFAQYEDETFEFDERGILVFKGFNSIGKSNAIRGLRLAMTCDKSNFQRQYIRWGETEASVNIFFSDGVEIEFLLMLSSLKSKARFSNGYNMYYHKGGVKHELFTTAVNGKYTMIREVPNEIARYFNLATVDEGTINIMKGSEGLVLFRQTPKSISKMLHQVAQMESVENAVKRIKNDNKTSMVKLQALDTRFQMYTNEIEDLKHITPEVLGILNDGQAKTNDMLSSKALMWDTLERIIELDAVPVPLYVNTLETEVLSELGLLEQSLNSLSDIEIYDNVEHISIGVLNDVNSVLQGLSNLDNIGVSPVNVETVSTGILSQLGQVYDILGNLESIEIPYSSKIDTVSIGLLNTLMGLDDSISTYKNISSSVREVERELYDTKKKMNYMVEKLKEAGHPLHRCSHCGEFSIVGLDGGHSHG